MILKGFEDLKAKRVLSMGNIVVEGTQGEPMPLEVWVEPGGCLRVREPLPVPIDQIGEREAVPRWQGVDQV